jgi:hypothetical protein
MRKIFNLLDANLALYLEILILPCSNKKQLNISDNRVIKPCDCWDIMGAAIMDLRLVNFIDSCL